MNLGQVLELDKIQCLPCAHVFVFTELVSGFVHTCDRVGGGRSLLCLIPYISSKTHHDLALKLVECLLILFLVTTSFSQQSIRCSYNVGKSKESNSHVICKKEVEL